MGVMAKLLFSLLFFGLTDNKPDYTFLEIHLMCLVKLSFSSIHNSKVGTLVPLGKALGLYIRVFIVYDSVAAVITL